MKPKLINGLLIAIGILLWIGLLGYHLMEQVLSIFEDGPASAALVGSTGYRIVLACFFIAHAILLSRIFSNIERLNVLTLLWRLFIIGMAGVSVILIITFANRLLQGLNVYSYFKPVFYCLGLYAATVFFLSAVFLFRRFILYPRTRRKLVLWNLFQGFLALGIGLLFFVRDMVLPVSYGFFILLIIPLAANVRWVSYLNFNQKLRALGLFVLVVLVAVTFLIAGQRLPEQLGVPMMIGLRMEFLAFSAIFTLVYSGFSILVLFFNLPTSSVFELENFEIASFSKINQAIQSNLDFTDIMNTLLDAALMVSGARAGWVELIPEGAAEAEVRIRKRISLEEIGALRQDLSLAGRMLREQRAVLIKNTRKSREGRHQDTRYRSLLAAPILSNNARFGAVVIASELVNAFEEVTIKSISSYAEQAGIAFENARLIKNSIEVERYQEQLKIAKEVQTQLLPGSLPSTQEIEFVSVSENADEVGGDYFDVLQAGPRRYRAAIGDVSGKGTTAAFYMAEIKGIFHALARLNLSVREFMVTANQAISACMQRGFFTTFTYLEIDLEARVLRMMRAGHCPAFYYSHASDTLSLLRDGTLGLGIVRNDSFAAMLPEAQELPCQPGDFLVLYTDGILEARNEQGEEFGYQRMEAVIQRNKAAPAPELAAALIGSVKTFAHSAIQDDYTILIIRFKYNLPPPSPY